MSKPTPNDPPVNPALLGFDEIFRQMGPCWRALMDSQGDQTTPRRTNGSVGAFLRALPVPGHRAFRVPVEPWGPVSNCHVNARRYARQHGLQHQFGWVIWQGTNYIEAEPHAVVSLVDGSYKCVTTTRDGERELVFLPDPSRDLTRREYAGDPDLYLISGYHNVPAKDPRIFEFRWLSPKTEHVDLVDW